MPERSVPGFEQWRLHAASLMLELGQEASAVFGHPASHARNHLDEVVLKEIQLL